MSLVIEINVEKLGHTSIHAKLKGPVLVENDADLCAVCCVVCGVTYTTEI